MSICMKCVAFHYPNDELFVYYRTLFTANLVHHKSSLTYNLVEIDNTQQQPQVRKTNMPTNLVIRGKQKIYSIKSNYS